MIFRIETCWSDFKCLSVKFYASALAGIIKVTLRSARCNNKDICTPFHAVPSVITKGLLYPLSRKPNIRGNKEAVKYKTYY